MDMSSFQFPVNPLKPKRPGPLALTIIALAILDAMAGFLSGLVFALGVIVSGNFTSRDEVLTVAGLFIIFYAPSLLASSIRPLRRIAKDRDSLWERVTDYSLVTLLSGWTLFKMIGGLNALAGVQLLITFDAQKIGIWTSIFVFIRLVLEDLRRTHIQFVLIRHQAR